MSFKLRMQEVSSPEELHDVMKDLWAFGSPKWTRTAVARYVPQEFADLLDDYFSADGELRSPGGYGPRSPEPEETEGGQADASASSPRTLSELISTFHARLDQVRARFPREEGGDATRVAVSISATIDFDEQYDEAGSTRVEIGSFEPPVPDIGFLCPICEKFEHAEPAKFRGAAMCRACANLLNA